MNAIRFRSLALSNDALDLIDSIDKSLLTSPDIAWHCVVALQGVWLDNFVVGDDIGAALRLAEETWRPKFDAFESIAAADKEKKDREMAKKKKER